MGTKLNVLVTGGNGFLGSHLVKKLISENHNVLVVSKNTNNLDSIKSQIKFIPSYIDELSSYNQHIQDFAPDVVVHFGWSGGNNYKDTNSYSQFQNNLPGSIDFLNFLSTLPKKPKFVGIGTFAEYGNYNTAAEEHFPENPINLYGMAKLVLKQYSHQLCKENNMKWVWVRPCFTYGPGDVSTRLIPTLISKFLKDKDAILDECRTIIDLIHIDDFTDFMFKLIISSYEGVYNISSGEKYHLKEVINTIHNIIKSKSNVTFDPLNNRSNAQLYVCADNSKIKHATGKNECKSLKHGLEDTINFHKLQHEL